MEEKWKLSKAPDPQFQRKVILMILKRIIAILFKVLQNVRN